MSEEQERLETETGHDDFYQRRLDRSPEKREFFKLPENDRRLICDLRSAMYSVYEKFTKLREQVSDRAEEPRTVPDLKPEDLVDMYGNPAVNEELRQRLTRPGRMDAKVLLADTSAHANSDDFSRERKKRHRSLELEDFEISVQKEKQKRSGASRRRGLSGVDRYSTTESDDEVAARKALVEDNKTPKSIQTDAVPLSSFPNQQNPGIFPPFYAWIPSPGMAPINGLQQMLFPPPSGVPSGYPCPPYPYTFGVTGPVPFAYPSAPGSGVVMPPDHEVPVRDTADDVKHKEQQMAALSAADAGHDLIMSFAQQPVSSANLPKLCAVCSAADGIGHVRTPVASSERCPVCAESYTVEFGSDEYSMFTRQNVATPLVDTAGPRKNFINKTLRRLRNSSTGTEGIQARQLTNTGTARLSSFSRLLDKPLKGTISQKLDKQLSILLEELEKSKDLNIKLHDELMVAEQELDSLRFICQNKDAEIRSQATGKLAVMVQDIYRAQKERDVAMMNRISRANAERDEALLKLKRLQQKFSELTTKKEPSVEEKKLSEILARLQNESTSDSIEHRGTEIIGAINHMKQQRWQVAAEEMRAVLEERDLAVAKCKDLEADLSQMRLRMRDEEASREQRQVLQGKLFAMEHERNLAMEKISKLEEEVLSLRIYYNLHGSLSQEVSLYQQFSKTLDEVQKQLHVKEEEMEVLQKDKQQLIAQFKVSADEKRKLAEELEKLQDTQKTERSRSEKLQRLVNVLRRKINSLGITPEEPE